MPRKFAYIASTPFTKLLEDYMYSQRPPLTVSALGDQTGIPKQTISGWWRDGRIPHPSTLERLAAGTGLPLDELLRVCGYPQSVAPLPIDPFEAVIAQIERNPRFSPEAKAAMIARIREVQSGQLAASGERYIAAEHEQVVEGGTIPSTPAQPALPTPPPSAASKPTSHTRRAPSAPRARVRPATDRAAVN